MEENNDIIEKFVNLLVRSEARVDKIAEAISKCAKVTENLTSEYIKQIDKLQEARDKMIEENKRLLQIVEKSQEDLKQANKNQEMIIEKLFHMATTGRTGSENNITLK